MTCCEPCDCIATVRVRQLVNADHSFDLLLDQQPSVREQHEWWYDGDPDRLLKHYHCHWSGTAEIDDDTRYQVRVWNSATRQPLLTIAPLNDDDRPQCLHVFSSLSDPHSSYAAPVSHQWSVDVTDEGSDVYLIEFRGQHLGYPVPLSLVGAGHDPGTVSRDEALQLTGFAQPGQPMTYRLTKALDLAGNPLALQLETWSGSPVPLTISATATADDIRYAIAPNQTVSHDLPSSNGTTESPGLYASPDAVGLTLELDTPAIPAESLPDGDTVTFSVWHADTVSFSGESELNANLLTLTGTGGSGSAAQSVSYTLPGITKRHVRVRAVASSGAVVSDYTATVRTVGSQSLPPISPDCDRGVFDLYAYSETIGDDSLGPQIEWSDLTVWLTFHEVGSPPTRTANDPVDRSYPDWDTDIPALFHTTGRVYVWPTDDADTLIDHLYRDLSGTHPHLQPPWWIADLSGGNNVQPDNTLASVWIAKSLDPLLTSQSMQLQSYLQVTPDAIILRLRHGANTVVYDAATHGQGWYEFRSTEPPDLISPKEYTLVFTGFYTQAADPDGELPVMFSTAAQQAANPWGSNTFGTPLNRPINQAGDSLNLHVTTFRALLTDFGRPAVGSTDPTWDTGYTLIMDGWAGGSTASGEVTDLNDSHLLTGRNTLTFGFSGEWTTIASGSVVNGISIDLINQTPFVDDQAAGLSDAQKQRHHHRWSPARQCLVVHVDGQHYYYRPKTRPAVSDDPDELLFEIDPDPPALTWPGTGSVSVTAQPAEITLRVGPALISSHCPECLENQQPTPMAFELTAPAITPADEPINLLRRADSMWAAHVAGTVPHWLDEDDPQLPDPLHDLLWILDGLETLRLYEVPVNGGDRRPIAVYRFRPIDLPAALPRADDPETPIDETFTGWQKLSLDCVSDRELSLWMFGQGYDPARHLLPSAVNLKPIGRQCVYGSADYDWQHDLNRWESDPGNTDEREPDDFGLPSVAVVRPDSDERTVCVGYDSADAGIVWIDGTERWRVFAQSCAAGDLPTVPASPDDGQPGEVRRISCYTPDPPDPPPSTCRWISNDGVTWEQIDPSPDEACPEGYECQQPSRSPDFVGDVEDGTCVPVSCLDGDSTWVWIQEGNDWFLQESSCPEWCNPVKPGYSGTPWEVASGGCQCPTCT